MCLLSAWPDGVDSARPIEAVVPGAQGRVLAVLAETTADLVLAVAERFRQVELK